MEVFYCKICGAVLTAQRRKYCGPIKNKQSCAYRALLERATAYGKTDRGRDVRRRTSQKNRAKIAAYYAEWYRLNGRKRVSAHQIAHNAVSRAVKAGKIVRPTQCPTCDSSQHRIEAHHEDYNKPLEIEWLCQPCHKKEHRNM